MLTKVLGCGAMILSVLIGCGAQVSDPEDVASDEAAARRRTPAATSGEVALKYEGTCEFLRNCSGPSRGLPAGQVMWGCEGRGRCVDDELWVAGPTRQTCGQDVRLCRGERCVVARVKDVSVTRDWEASNGVLDALGIPYGLTGRCAGFGGARVTVDLVPAQD